MRRLIVIASTLAALAAALTVGPLGVASAAPYVYGCTPATIYNDGVSYVPVLTIYNGSASTANLTHKILAGTGLILNQETFPVTSTLPATHTKENSYSVAGNTGPDELNATTPATIRVVSNVPVAVTLVHDITGGQVAISCPVMQP
jgi:hypothetical protein